MQRNGTPHRTTELVLVEQSLALIGRQEIWAGVESAVAHILPGRTMEPVRA